MPHSRPSRPFGSSIRSRLGLFLVLAFVPVIALVAHLLLLQRAEQIEAMGARALLLAQQGAAREADLVAQARGAMEVLALVPEVRDAAPGACQSLLRTVALKLPWATGLAVATEDGTVVCEGFNRSYGVGDRPYFRRAVESGAFTVSDFLVDRASGRSALVAALPLPAGGRGRVLMAGLDLGWFGAVAAEAGRAARGIVVAVDPRGTVVARWPEPERYVGRDESGDPLVRALLAAPLGTVEQVGLDGVHRVFGFASLGGTGARVAVGFAKDDIVAQVDERLAYGTGIVALLGLAAVAGVWLLLEVLLLRGLRHLHAVADRLSAGDFRLPDFEAAAAREVGDLARAFSNMAREMGAAAHQDRLTGLPNRRFLDAFVARAAERGPRGEGCMAFLYLDLDGFKPVNDVHGHHAGDLVLQQVAARLRRCVRDGDAVVRLGGDEFVLLVRLPEGDCRHVGHEVGGRLVRAMEEPFDLGDAEASVGCSVGLAVWPDDGADPREVLKLADAALYRAKRGGRGRLEVHGAGAAGG